MGKSHQKSGQSWRRLGNLSEASADRVCGFLRALYPERTAENVAADLGCSVDTARKWFDGVCAPSFIWFSRMISVYGPQFLAAAFDQPDGWLTLAARMDEQEKLEAELARIKSELARSKGRAA